uniref:Integrin-linked kinase-associated serine/threonine phosphatase 2C n=1 Tax=Amphilophus citrinellus TaxID=61819 RepID=A0A3Q0QSF0_AMPCI
MDLFDDLPEPTQTSGESSVGSIFISSDLRALRSFSGGRVLYLRAQGLFVFSCSTTMFVCFFSSNQMRADVNTTRRGEGPSHALFVCSGLPVLRAYVAARRGEREEMQDAHVLLPDMSSCLSRVSYFAVFDGHGGARASQFAAENLHHILAKKFPRGDAENVDKLIKRCLLDTFKQTDEDFLKKASSQKPAWKDGSTATCVLVVDDMVYVANLGDSRVSWESVTLALSKEHNPTIYEERMRIQRAGGTVRDGRVLGVLEVSRSIGDGQYKRCGVISTPDLRRCQLTPNDRFVILACDGLFKVFSADEAVKFVLDVLQEGSAEQRAGLMEGEQRFEAACQQLAGEAVRRGCADNVTVILVSIGC